MDCLPKITNYSVTISSNGGVTGEVVPTRTISVPLEQDVTITVIPSNTFGFGSPASATFSKCDHALQNNECFCSLTLR